MSSVAPASANTNGLHITPSASAAHTDLDLVWPCYGQISYSVQIYHDEDESLQEVEVEDVLALQGKPDAESESEESGESDQLSTSSSDDESEGD